jgi:hypothetical protein
VGRDKIADCGDHGYLPADRISPPEPIVDRSRSLPKRGGAFLIVVNIAKLPSVPRQILKDIPRPPNTANRDD